MSQKSRTKENARRGRDFSVASPPPGGSTLSALLRVSLLVLIFAAGGTSVGLGIFPRERLAYEPAGAPTMDALRKASEEPGMVGQLITEQHPGGTITQRMELAGAFSSDLGGGISMSLREEPAEILRARFEAEARRNGWKSLDDWSPPSGNMDFYYRDGKVRIVSIEEHSGDLRSVTVFDGDISKRAGG